MSYARFGDESDVYVYSHCDGSLQCCACRITGMGGKWAYDTTDEILAHLEKHIARGDKVPDYCIEGLKAEREENDAFIAHMRAGGTEDSFAWKPPS